jgi:hypothetical protein
MACRHCGRSEPDVKFQVLPSGGKRRVCWGCLSRQKTKANGERRRRGWREARRLNPVAYLIKDCKRSDRLRGLVSDLDREFVAATIAGGCSYCGETTGRIGLDRSDNTGAHTKSNVVACCMRCNYMRGTMPLEAWMCLVPAVRQARERGLFGTWRSTPIARLKKAPMNDAQTKPSDTSDEGGLVV